MTRSAPAAIERRQFDDFLFASIGSERNGMLLTVLSALARLDIDPWREAADLAEMSRDAAIERLRSLLGAMPEDSPARSDPEAIADRLIALLPPRQVVSAATSTLPAPGAAGVANKHRIAAILVLMALLLGPQFLMRSAQSAAQADALRGPTAGAAPSPNPPP
jgi:hypothetical protein